jgi:hypothetical protein
MDITSTAAYACIASLQRLHATAGACLGRGSIVRWTLSSPRNALSVMLVGGVVTAQLAVDDAEAGAPAVVAALRDMLPDACDPPAEACQASLSLLAAGSSVWAYVDAVMGHRSNKADRFLQSYRWRRVTSHASQQVLADWHASRTRGAVEALEVQVAGWQGASRALRLQAPVPQRSPMQVTLACRKGDRASRVMAGLMGSAPGPVSATGEVTRAGTDARSTNTLTFMVDGRPCRQRPAGMWAQVASALAAA